MREAIVEERFAPITSSAGYLRTDLDVVARYFETWSNQIGHDVHATRLDETFPEVLYRLEPLTAGWYPREVFIEMGDEWVAYFSCSMIGTDGPTMAAYLAQTLMCDGIALCIQAYHPTTPDIRGQYGAVQFEVFGARNTDFLNCVRAVSVARDYSGWSFETGGAVQPYEDEQAYKSRRKADRFTPEMLERYCKALGLDAFRKEAYGPRAVLFESSLNAPIARSMSLEQTRVWRGLDPVG